METLTLYLEPCGMPKWCHGSVTRNEAGEVLLPDMKRCVFKASAHKEAIERATYVLTHCPKRHVESLPFVA
jgi:hypothetical protein